MSQSSKPADVFNILMQPSGASLFFKVHTIKKKKTLNY